MNFSLYTVLRKALVFAVFIMGFCIVASAQYQSLLWKVEGRDIKDPSYLYGTMHISGKVAFQLGDPFYDAMQSVDVVALELEPEAWFKALFSDPQVASWLGSSSVEEEYLDEFIDDSPLPPLRGFWSGSNVQSANERVRQALLYDPAVLNYLMFRYGEGSGAVDFEEDTWLDMHIYQAAKKMGLQTMGLETYAQSDEFIRKTSIEDAREDNRREWDEGDILEFEQLTNQLEPAYRRQDLDLIDSLSQSTASKAFRTYILLERNKLFVHNIDSLLRAGKSLFAAMGCAHLPGNGGVIEILRSMGYEVTPVNKGTRNAKRRQELDRRIYQRAFAPFTTSDGRITTNVPAELYHAASSRESSTHLCLDIANGANFTITRMKSYSALTGTTTGELLVMLDSMMYETVAGEVVSKSIISKGKYEGIEVINKTRRGDYHRQQVIVLPDEILILKLEATGEKVKQGYGASFFEGIKIHEAASQSDRWSSADSSLQVNLPSQGICYASANALTRTADLEVIATRKTNGAFYMLQRHVIERPDFLDEDNYELRRFLKAFCIDNNYSCVSSSIKEHNGVPAIQSVLKSGVYTVHALFVIHALSYVVLSTNEEDEQSRSDWFSSFTIGNSTYSQFTTYQNSELCFTTTLPYTPLEPQVSLDAILFNADLESEQDLPFGTNASIVLNPPGNAESIQVDFQRYHEYSDGENKSAFLREKRERVLGLDMRMIRQTAEWTDDGAVFEFIVGDTSTTRRFKHRMVLHNKSFYHLSTCYDSIVGLSDFVIKAFDNFHSNDTVFPYPHFNQRDEAYLKALVSDDSLVRERAFQITGEMDFLQGSTQRMRELIKALPYFEGEEAGLIKEKLVSGLAADTSSVNINFLEKEFAEYPDSAVYQYDLLTTLLRIKTGKAWKAYARLVVEEPPIVFDEMGGSGCEVLFDSVRLAAPLIPQLMQLLAIDEYEESIYHLMALAVDSGWLPTAAYRYLVPQILVEARNEWKRLKSGTEEGYGLNSDVLLDFCSILQPLRKEKDVDAFFKKLYTTRKGSLLLDIARFSWDHNSVPSDTVIQMLIRMNDQVHGVYNLLWDHAATNKMPIQLSTRQSLAELYLKNRYQSEDESIDTVLLVQKCQKEIRGVVLDVHYYKVFKASSNQWLGHVFAFDMSENLNAWPLFIESDRMVVLDDDEDAIHELDEEYLYLEELNREFVNFGAGSTDFSVQWY